jgi:SAM-dependent methyltransferase
MSIAFLILTILFTFLTAAAIAAAILLLGMIAFVWVGVPFVPTPNRNIERILDALDIQPGQRVYDLGCGDGRLVIAAATRGAQTTGFEVSPWAFLRACVNGWRSHSRANIIFGNFYSKPLADADVVFVFLLNTVMPKLETKLRRELKPGTVVGSYGFTFPNWQPEKIIEMPGSSARASKLYLYRQPSDPTTQS